MTLTMSSLLACKIILVLAVLIVASQTKELPVQVQTTEGTTTGFSSNGVRYWYNLPYAQPPVGELRFSPPKPPKSYQGVYDATNSSNQIKCKQYGLPSSEDCLYLDVYAPLESSKDFPNGYPVLFFIHGGSFYKGYKNKYSDGTPYAQNETVAVIINYRLNVFGFMRVDDMTPGNNGFLDQQLALQWANQNIAAFGGDPKRITIAGHSAGANSVLLHLVAPQSKGLFQGAISESGVPQALFPTKEDSMATSSVVLSFLGCKFGDHACLTAVPADALIQAFITYAYLCLNAQLPYYAYNLDISIWGCGLGPEAENEAIPQQPTSLLKKGKLETIVPLVIGFAWNEGLSLSDGVYNPLRTAAPELYENHTVEQTQPMYIQYLNEILDHQSYQNNSKAQKKLLSDRAQQVYDMYPLKVNKDFKAIYPKYYNGYNESALDANYLLDALLHDRNFVCSGRDFIRQIQSSLGKQSPNIYLYQWNYVPSYDKTTYEEEFGSDPTTAIENGWWSFNLYSTHKAELDYIFSNEQYFFSDKDQMISDRIISVWINFVHSGDPNEGPREKEMGEMKWTVYNKKEDETMIFQNPKKDFVMEPILRQKQCDFWDDFGYVF